MIWKTAHSQLPGPQISSRARNPPGLSSPPARRFGWVCFTFLSTSLPSLPICGARVMPGILMPCDGDASCPWEVWQRPESQGKLCGRAWRLEQLPTSQSSSPATGPSFLLHLSLSLLPSTSPCQRLCKELELADTLISCRDCSARAGLPGEGRKKEQQNFVPCHQGASFVRDASLLSTGPSGLLSCFATWVLLAVTGARAVFELWSSCWVGASPLGLPSGLLLADGDVLLLVSSFPALWKEKKKRACSPFLPWCLLSGSSQHRNANRGRVPAFANPRGLPARPAERGAWLCITQSPELLLRARLLGQTGGAVPRLPLLSVPRLLRDLTRGDLFLCTVFKLAWGRGPALSLWRTRRSPAASCPCSCISP